MKIAVIGATGQIGRRCCSIAVEKNFLVTALMRDPSRFPADLLDKVNVVKGDVGNVQAIDEALVGKDAVVCCLGTSK